MSSNVPLSFGIDPFSDLILESGSCIRTIPKFQAKFYREFCESTCAKLLVEKEWLIPSEIVHCDDHVSENLTIRHPEIPHVLYPYEWAPSMLKDAALLYLELIDFLGKYGYTLKDGHPWNIVFNGPRPVWVDLTSIIKMGGNEIFVSEDFDNYFTRPLFLFSMGLNSYARLILTQLMGPSESWLENGNAMRAARAYSFGSRSGAKFAIREAKIALKGKLFPKSTGSTTKSSIDNYKRKIIDLDVSPKEGYWTNYYKGMNNLPNFDPANTDLRKLLGSTPKHKYIYDFLDKFRPSSVLDIGCNSGLYAFMAESLGAKVVGIDTDEHAINAMYEASKNKNSNATTGLSDFVTPMRTSEYLHKPRLRSLHSRVRSEMTLCLALIHHWVFKRLQLKFSDIVEILDEVSEKVLIVEFVPPEDEHVSRWMNEEYSWYNESNFVGALKCKFKSVDIFESFPMPRKLMVCQK